MQARAHAAARGQATEDEAGGVGAPPGLYSTSPTYDSCHAVPAAQALKRMATCKARAALAGITLTSTEGDDGRLLLIATRWSLTRSFTNIDECEAWLNRVCGVEAK